VFLCPIKYEFQRNSFKAVKLKNQSDITMFQGIYNKTFKELPSTDEIVASLNRVGYANSISGRVTLTPFESNFAYSSKCTVNLNNYKNEFAIQIIYDFKPSLLAWIIGICFFPLGFLIFIFPHNAKRDFEYQLHTINW